MVSIAPCPALHLREPSAFFPLQELCGALLCVLFLFTLCQATLGRRGGHPQIRTFGAVGRAWIGELERVQIPTLSLNSIVGPQASHSLPIFSLGKKGKKKKDTITGALWALHGGPSESACLSSGRLPGVTVNY